MPRQLERTFMSPEDREELDRRRWRHFDDIYYGREERGTSAREQLEREVLMLQRADAYREILKLKEAGRFFSPDDDPAGFLEVAEGFEKMAADIRRRVEEAGRKEQIETNLLGALFIDNELVPECVDRLVPSDFQDDACQEIFSAIVDLHNNNEPVDLITLTSILKERGVFKSAGLFF